jgi:N-acetylgalactosamine kinase
MNIDHLLSELNVTHNLRLKNSYFEEIKNIYHFSDDETFDYFHLFTNLIREFKNTFPKDQDIHILRAPGRVNLIGEHLDYNGYPVFPIAIEKNVIIFFSKRKDNLLKIQNHDIRFESREFELSKSTIPFPNGDWGNYIKAGILGLDLPEIQNFTGFNALLYGNIPIAGGLSSSSALVVASCLAFLKTNKIVIDKIELANILAKAERYVGTMGGGMDQAIILFGENCKALKIDFFPLQIESYSLPEDYDFIIANTGIKASKTEKMKNEYNRRPIECKITAAIFKKYLENEVGHDINIFRLSDIEKVPVQDEVKEKILNNYLSHTSYNSAEISKILDININDFVNTFLIINDGEIFPEPTDGFKLRQRYNYVMNEKRRVQDSIKFIEDNEIEEFGKLLVESHNDARNQYEISAPELDKMVEVSLEGGATGARLTGAGFGGCCIILSKKERTNQLIEHIKKEYYNIYLKNNNEEIYNKMINLDDQIFICDPSSGARFLFEFHY